MARGKSLEERSRLRVEVEARRDHAKDRAVHEKSRGVTTSAKNLLRRLPDAKETELILVEINAQSDRGAALIVAALVDQALQNSTYARIVNLPERLDGWFQGESGVFLSLSQKIQVCRALGIIGELSESHLNSIRAVRNQFAHTVFPIDFEHEAIAKECNGLPMPGEHWHPQYSENRRKFVFASINLILALAKDFKKARRRQIKRGLS